MNLHRDANHRSWTVALVFFACGALPAWVVADVDLVTKTDALHRHRQLMVAIQTATQDMQTQIYFCRGGKCLLNHF